jgi:hypothetical protein
VIFFTQNPLNVSKLSFIFQVQKSWKFAWEQKKLVSSLNNPSNIEMIEALKTIIIITCYYYRNNISLLIWQYHILDYWRSCEIIKNIIIIFFNNKNFNILKRNWFSEKKINYWFYLVVAHPCECIRSLELSFVFVVSLSILRLGYSQDTMDITISSIWPRVNQHTPAHHPTNLWVGCGWTLTWVKSSLHLGNSFYKNSGLYIDR